MSVQDIRDEEDFQMVLDSIIGSEFLVIDFYAQWCKPCKNIAPEYSKLASVYTNLTFLKIDVDSCDTVADQYQVGSLPTFLFINRETKEVVNRIEGTDMDQVEKYCKKYNN